MKTDSSDSYSRTQDKQTTPLVDSEKVLIGHHGPIDVNNDQSADDEFKNYKIDDNEQFKGTLNTDLIKKKNLKTLFIIAFVTILLFLLAGLSIKFNTRTNDATKNSPGNSDSQVSVDTSTLDSTVDDGIGSLSEILAVRISLISSKNPKFIVTAEGTKIVPSDIIKGGMTVVDIHPDHIVVSLEGGKTKKITY